MFLSLKAKKDDDGDDGSGVLASVSQCVNIIFTDNQASPFSLIHMMMMIPRRALYGVVIVLAIGCVVFNEKLVFLEFIIGTTKTTTTSTNISITTTTAYFQFPIVVVVGVVEVVLVAAIPAALSGTAKSTKHKQSKCQNKSSGGTTGCKTWSKVMGAGAVDVFLKAYGTG